MSPTCVILAWRPATAGQLRLWIGDRITIGDGCRYRRRWVDVPVGVVDALRGPDGPSLTVDPAADLIRAESRWRLHAAHLEDTSIRLQRAATTVFADLYALPDRPSLLPGVLLSGDRHRLSTRIRQSVGELAASVRALTVARSRVRAVREFVVALDVPDGLLAGARAGWRRHPARPSFVSTYATERLFVTADPCRAAPSTTRPAVLADQVGPVAGEVFGVSWRRDGDDDDPYTDEPAVIGPWQLGYIPTTGEIYATRRCHYRDPQVWLLASGHTDPDRTRRLLSDLKRHMGEPNSLLHAAHVAHHAAHTTAHHDAHATASTGETGQR